MLPSAYMGIRSHWYEALVSNINMLILPSDIDEKNLTYARQNIEHNALGSRIRVFRTERFGSLLPLDELGLLSYISFRTLIWRYK